MGRFSSLRSLKKKGHRQEANSSYHIAVGVKMTFVFRDGVGTMEPLGGGAAISLAAVRTTVELYRLAHGALFVSDRETKNIGPLDLHACRQHFCDWMCYERQIHAMASDHDCCAYDIKAAINLINPQPVLLVVPEQAQVAAQQNATRYACLARTLDVLPTDLLNLCASYSDIEPSSVSAKHKKVGE
jgi:hypothetical protein